MLNAPQTSFHHSNHRSNHRSKKLQSLLRPLICGTFALMAVSCGPVVVVSSRPAPPRSVPSQLDSQNFSSVTACVDQVLPGFQERMKNWLEDSKKKQGGTLSERDWQEISEHVTLVARGHNCLAQ